jgi:hypothetical protein
VGVPVVTSQKCALHPLMKRTAIFLILTVPTTAWACPFCRDATASGSGAGTPVFNTSIYFMLGGLLVAASLMIGALSSGFRRRG